MKCVIMFWYHTEHLSVVNNKTKTEDAEDAIYDACPSQK